MNTAEAMRYLNDRGARIPRFEDIDRFIGFEFPIQAMMTEALPADESLKLWQTARAHAPRTGLVPVLVGAEPMIDWFAGADCEEVLQRLHAHRALSPSIAVLETLEQRAVQRFSASVVEQLRAEMNAIRPAWRVLPGHGADCVGHETDSAPDFLAEEEEVRCILLQCPAVDVPIYLGLGGWNDSPQPHEQSAIFSRWNERFGTQIAHVGRSSIGLWSTRPPTRIDEYRELLWETFLYCHNTAFQDGDATFSGMRQMLAQPWWSFFWD